MVGTIEDVVKKGEQIAADVARSRGQEKTAETAKASGAPAPSSSKGKRADHTEVLAILKKMADDGRTAELKKASEIHASFKVSTAIFLTFLSSVPGHCLPPI